MAGSDEPLRDGRADETTRRLLDAAAEVFIEDGYDKAVVANVARRAGMTVGAIYARWPRKSDVMSAAAHHIFEQILPDQMMRKFGIEEWPVADILSAWALSLLGDYKTQDVLVQAFASAHNNEAVQERLQWFLDEQADQLDRLIDRGKVELPDHPGYSTVALALLIQAIGIGTHLLLSAGRDERHIPSEHEWTAMIDRVIEALSTPTQPPR